MKTHLIDMDRIESNPFQPTMRDTKPSDEMVNAMKRNGFVGALAGRIVIDGELVTADDRSGSHSLLRWMRSNKDAKIQIAFGHRRVEAARAAGLTQIPIQIADWDDQTMAAQCYEENALRKNLTAIEQAEQFQIMMDRFDMKSDALGEMIGISGASIRNKQRLLKLPNDVQLKIISGDVSERQAVSLLPVFKENELGKTLIDYCPAAANNLILNIQHFSSREVREVIAQMNDQSLIERKKEFTDEMVELAKNSFVDGDPYPVYRRRTNIDDLIDYEWQLYKEDGRKNVIGIINQTAEYQKNEIVPIIQKFHNLKNNFVQDKERSTFDIFEDEIKGYIEDIHQWDKDGLLETINYLKVRPAPKNDIPTEETMPVESIDESIDEPSDDQLVTNPNDWQDIVDKYTHDLNYVLDLHLGTALTAINEMIGNETLAETIVNNVIRDSATDQTCKISMNETIENLESVITLARSI